MDRRPQAVLALAVGSPLVALVHFVVTPIARKLSYVPDDAFYYLQLGREWSRTGVWSFDAGRSTTTGFHLVQAYYCAFLQRCVHGADRVLAVQAIAGVLLALASLLMLRAATERLFPRGSLFAMLTVGCSGAATILPLQGMESPFVMVCGAVAAFAFATSRQRLLAAALVVGPLCRADFVLVGLGLALATVSTDPRFVVSRRRLALVAGATLLGGALVVLHTYVVDGHFFQTSARVKAHWGAVLGYQLSYGVEPVGYAFTPAGILTLALNFGPALHVIPFALLLGGAWLGREAKLDPPATIALRWGVVTALLFVLVYGRVSAAAMCWYGASFFMPLFLAIAGFAAKLPSPVRKWSTIAAVPVALVVIADSHRPIWNATGRYEAITRFAQDGIPGEAPSVVAAWNAGALGYLGGERTVNIDGLVNDDVVPYILENRVPCYLLHEGIPYVIDDPEWPKGRNAAFLGVSDPRLMAALVPIPPLPSGLGGWRVDFARLAAEPACAKDERSARSRAARPWALAPAQSL